MAHCKLTLLLGVSPVVKTILCQGLEHPTFIAHPTIGYTGRGVLHNFFSIQQNTVIWMMTTFCRKRAIFCNAWLVSFFESWSCWCKKRMCLVSVAQNRTRCFVTSFAFYFFIHELPLGAKEFIFHRALFSTSSRKKKLVYLRVGSSGYKCWTAHRTRKALGKLTIQKNWRNIATFVNNDTQQFLVLGPLNSNICSNRVRVLPVSLKLCESAHGTAIMTAFSHYVTVLPVRLKTRLSS